jgi:hypothetical protein
MNPLGNPQDKRPSTSIIGTSLRPGNNLTLNLPKGVVTVSLDHLGDWTITIGLPAGTDKTNRLTNALTSLGFFQAAESEGIAYLLWTSAFDEPSDARELAELVLVKALRTIQETSIASYIS